MLALGIAVLMGPVVVPPTAVAAPVAYPDSAPTEATATVIARQTGKAVRVDALTDGSTEVLANPDGTFTMTQHVLPVRVERGDDWVPVDTTLVQRPDGGIGPRAAAVDIAISPGGEGAPLVAAEQDGAEVGLVWPEALPRPILDGPTATYPEVMPGVDLAVTAEVTGFSQVLVVKNREAGRNAELRSVAFGTHTENAEVRADEGNGAGRDSDTAPAEQEPGDALAVEGADGEPVFIGDATRMWDSAGEATRAERLTGSADGANTAAMDATVSPTAVTIRPDTDFLADPDTVYPVYLDPSYTCTSPNCGKAHHAVVQSAWPTARNYNRTDGALSDLKAGYTCNDSPCSVSRTYLGMKTGSLAGKIIHSADLHVEVIKSARCGDATPTELWRSNSINSDFTWATQQNWQQGSGWGTRLSTGNVTNNPTYCPATGTGSGMDLNATAAVVDAAAGGWAVTTFMLKGQSESGDSSWRRFDLNPFLVVTYNSRPNAPTELGITAATKTFPCTTGAGRAFVGTRTPKLRARVSDPDGATLSAGFRVFVGPHNNTGASTDTTDSSTPSGQFAEVTLPAGRISADGVHTWRVWANDGDVSTWSGNCEMHIDTVTPGTPTITSASYPAGHPGGGVGVPGTFTLSPPATDPHQDIDYYLYGFTDTGGEPVAKANPSQLNAPATISWVAQKSGPQVLTVKAVDRAGNTSAAVNYPLTVADYQVGVSGKVAHWSFADSLADTSGIKTLGFTGLPPEGSYGPGANDEGAGAHFAPDAGMHYQTSGALVRTDRAFTLSAWAKLTSDTQDHVALALTGTVGTAVDLRYSHADAAWAVVATGGDGGSVITKVTAPATLDAWTHLAVVYDPAAGNALRLHVNGAVAGQGTVPGSLWNATGPLFIGGGKTQTQPADYFTGALDTIRLHDSALDTTQIAALHAGTGSHAPTAEYLLENDLLNSGSNYDLSWASTTNYGTGYDGKSIDLDRNVGLRPKTSMPVIRTDQDFSVGAWVKLRDKDRHYAVVSQDGDRMAGFLVRYASDVDRWIFGLADQDTDAGTYQWAIGTTSPKIGEWTHITAVHDATTDKIRLYVNGVLEAERTQATPMFTATGGFAIGNYRARGTGSGHLSGDIDEVAVYNGVLSPSAVADLVNTPVERARYLLDVDGADQVGGPAASVYGTGVQWGSAGGHQAGLFAGHHMEGTGVVSGGAPLAQWSFDNALTDASGNGRTLQHRNATTTTTATYGAPWVGTHGVQLNGTDQRLQTTGQLVNTASSFTISAWVKLDRANASFTVASQDGNQTSPFILRHSGTLSRWVFAVTSADQTNPGLTQAVSTLPGKVGYWTHLVAVYDAATGRARLHVDGELDHDVAVAAPWASTGPFVLGRLKAGSGQGEFLPGALDEVKVYDRALAAADVHKLWNLGSDVHAPLPEEFRADRSFTIAAWARPTDYGPIARKVFSLGGSGRFSALTVGYRPEWQRWGVLVEGSGGAVPDPNWILSDNEASTYGANSDGWVHLAVSYDAVREKVLFFVNGVEQTTVPVDGTTVEPASGTTPYHWYAGADLQMPDLGDQLLIGRITWMGLAAHNWSGAIRDVRVFSGVLPRSCDHNPVCFSQLPVL
ncbi:LamG-like jellyroll fold domain-containing protein [Actinokineospora guangxiensis]|uniref:LamG-like jellyroll fold domain-containing protein n=1 Tax=Actinokineospora guangxiensis TaxID=1490288 RepID=A0ABW0EIU1_9PSEU